MKQKKYTQKERIVFLEKALGKMMYSFTEMHGRLVKVEKELNIEKDGKEEKE